MNRQSIHQQIDLLIKALREQHEQSSQSKNTIPQMELDTMLQNTRQLYEAVLMLNHTNALSSLDEVKNAVMQRILAEKKLIEKKTEEIKSEVTKPVETVLKEATPEPVHHTKMEELEIKAADVHPVEEQKEKLVKKKLSGGVNATLFEDAHTLGDNFEDGESLHEHIAAKTGNKSIADNLHRKPIHDLKASIGINEKFLFINQLFDGNLQDYSEAVDKLNSAGDLNAAKQFISAQVASRFNWSDHDNHVKHFMDLVERRFIA